jgi:hypothetical protein
MQDHIRRKNLNSKSKKGNAPIEVIFIFIIMIIFAIVAFFGYKALSDINTQLQKTDALDATGKEMLQKSTTAYPKVMDNAVFFILIVLSIFAIAFAFMIDTSPIFFFVTIILIIAGGFAIVLLANSSINILDASGVSLNFPKTTWIFHHLLETFLIIGMLIAGALYAKSQL